MCKGFHSAVLKQQFDELFQGERTAEQAVPRPEQVKAGLEALVKGLRKRGFADYPQLSRQVLAE